ncbi:Bug family tripartite tricarboxylate transporter substrate binding protein [Advenella mimigardefordensis]|uniref:Putative Bug-like extracytoplasmic solute binding receptor, TTT family n=1 Tax=Advenella mimigardefordensis (strain DSM 17166 / LMG 22922 / DPN7) TaxID=1247726 RepID=W0PAB3_ADVMD|nr:tripartite tricarboxylate transporter substrate binding protein [Advenella mimigardefordensis]AHG63774.1 putative Bug-like extracytoplasmic solute binding receptor, TTT family [Advenella mimigardefordensis DPN7]
MKRSIFMAILLPLACTPALAAYPERPITWVIPSPPGDGSDSIGRLLADKVGRALGQTIVVQNKPGAGGVIGSESVANAKPDGYAMIVGNAGSHGINAAIYSKLRYDVVKSFKPVGLFCTTANVLAVRQDLPVSNVKEFVAYIKNSKTSLNYSSGGIGSSAHLSAELFKSLADVPLVHIPYRGATPAVQAVLSDEVVTMVGNLPPWLSQIKSGKAKALAVTTKERVPELPDVPTLAETYPGFETVAWFGLLAPADTPNEIIERVNKQINEALASPDIQERLKAVSCAPAGGTSEEFAERIRNDVSRWKKLAQEKNIKAD